MVDNDVSNILWSALGGKSYLVDNGFPSIGRIKIENFNYELLFLDGGFDDFNHLSALEPVPLVETVTQAGFFKMMANVKNFLKREGYLFILADADNMGFKVRTVNFLKQQQPQSAVQKLKKQAFQNPEVKAEYDQNAIN